MKYKYSALFVSFEFGFFYTERIKIQREINIITAHLVVISYDSAKVTTIVVSAWKEFIIKY